MGLEALESERKKALLFSGLLFSLAALLFLGGLLWEEGRGALHFLAALALVLAYAPLRAYKLMAKKALAAPLAEALGFRYEPEGGLPREEALASGLFPTPDRYEAEDLVAGEVRGFPFAASDVRLYRKVRTRNGSYYQKFFGGTLYRFALPFAVEGEVRLGPQGRGRVAGGSTKGRLLLFLLFYGFVALFVLAVFLESVGSQREMAWGTYAFLLSFVLVPLLIYWASTRGEKRLSRVALEGPEFERLFDVYGEDQVASRKLLTPALQEALVAFRKRVGKPLWMAVKGNTLWLAVEGKDRLEPPLLRPLTRERVAAYARKAKEELEEVAWAAETLRLEEAARKRGVFPGGG